MNNYTFSNNSNNRNYNLPIKYLKSDYNNVFDSPYKQEDTKKSSRHNNISFNLNNILHNNSCEPIITIFDISLFLDDLIILGILFFLYNEGINDYFLFIVLLLLLLS